MESPPDIVIETTSHEGRHRYVCSTAKITCCISGSSKRKSRAFGADLAELTSEYSVSNTGSYYSRAAMFMMLSPMVLLFVAPIVLAGTRIPPGYMFAAFALWFLAVAAVAVRRDVCCTLHYQEGYRVFEVIGRTSDRERILEFVGRVLLRAQELKMTSEKLNKHLQPTPR